LYTVERSFLLVGGRELALHLPRGRVAPMPSVLVFHSAMGRTESVLDWCDRLAERGFAAVALDFYNGRTAVSLEEGRRLRDSANDRSTLLREIVAQAWTEMHNDARLRSAERFLLGWSYGAGWATYSSGFLPEVTGVVAFYGHAFTDNPNLHSSLHAPILFIGGEADTAPPPGELQDVVRQLNTNGKLAEVFLVSAGHGFAERGHPGYNHDAAEEAWDKVTEFLESTVR
jgi:dienelactone hydrolase